MNAMTSVGWMCSYPILVNQGVDDFVTGLPRCPRDLKEVTVDESCPCRQLVVLPARVDCLHDHLVVCWRTKQLDDIVFEYGDSVVAIDIDIQSNVASGCTVLTNSASQDDDGASRED